MGKFVLEDGRVYVGGYNLSGDSNRITCNFEADTPDATVFTPGGAREYISGLDNCSLDLSGFWEADTGHVDTVVFPLVGGVAQNVTLTGEAATAGNKAYSFQALKAAYNIGGAVGEVFPFTLRARGKGVLVRGTIMVNAALTATGTSTARQLGAVTASQKLYAVMHVLAVSGTTPTLDMVVQSDDAEGFLSPTARITFAQAMDIGSEWKTADGAITDTWYRLNYTIGGTNPSFTVVVNVGIR